MKKEEETWWYWLWVHFTTHGSNFNISHNTTSKERKEISEKVKKRNKEFILIFCSGLIFVMLMFGIALYFMFK